MYHEYPYSTYYDDIDEICRMCRDLGLRLEVKNDYLRLIDKKGNILSNVQISYAEKARYDDAGHFITSYIINIGADAHKLVINHGNGSVSTVTVPYAEEAQTALDCIVELQSNEDGIFYRFGNGDNGLIVPGYATKAGYSDKGRDIDEFATQLVNDGDYIGLKDNYNTFLSRIIPALATKAQKDIDGDDIKSTYANDIQNGVNTVKLLAKDGTVLKELLIGYAEKAKYDENENEIDTFYGHSLASVNGSIQLKDAHGNVLSTAEVHDLDGISQVQVIGDQLVFTNGAGNSVSITVPYAIKCLKDSLNNTIVNTYIASVQNDPQTGALNFLDATGALVCTLTPTVTQASQDNYGNEIADYIKSLVVDNQSDYVIATHGDGTTDTLTINYSNVAWKDTNGNVIKNTYTKRIEFIEDPTDHHMKLVGYNGDTPEAEIWRTDMLVDLQDLPFGASLALNGQALSLIDRNSNVLSTVNLGSSELVEDIGPLEATSNRPEGYYFTLAFEAYDQRPIFKDPGQSPSPIAGSNDTFSAVQGNTYYIVFRPFSNDYSAWGEFELPGKMYCDRNYVNLVGANEVNTNNVLSPILQRFPVYSQFDYGNIPNFNCTIEDAYIVPLIGDYDEIIDKQKFNIVVKVKANSNETVYMTNLSAPELYFKYTQYGYTNDWEMAF